MRRLKHVLSAAVLALLSACALRPVALAPSAEVGISEGVLWYRGEIADVSTLQRLLDLYEQQELPPRLLRIDSQGGDVHLALSFGEWIQSKGLDVEVAGQCASACANYVFTAGQRKLLRPDSLLLWHGGAYQTTLEEDAVRRGESVHQALLAWREREQDFFARAGIDPLITVYGQLPVWAAPYRDGGYLGYDYSLDDLARFGVRGVEEIEGAWQPHLNKPEARVLRIAVDSELLERHRLASPGTVDSIPQQQ